MKTTFVFDTETTGLIENRIIKLDKQPDVIEFFGCDVDLDTGEVSNKLNLLIKPRKPLPTEPAWGEKKTITEITGITNEMLNDAPHFKDVADVIFSRIENASEVVAHNAHFDQEMLNIEAERLQRVIKWPPVICSIEQTMHLKGKRLSLTALHEFLFKEKFADAHRAEHDVLALARCCTELRKRGII
jgi:DNA polymerase III epsilon subunit family exonuclease